MRAKNCFRQVCAKFALQTPDGDNIVVTAFEDTLRATAQDVSRLSKTELAEVLFLIENVLVKCDCNTVIVKCFMISFKTANLW